MFTQIQIYPSPLHSLLYSSNISAVFSHLHWIFDASVFTPAHITPSLTPQTVEQRFSKRKITFIKFNI